jgi:hypothetical protein
MSLAAESVQCRGAKPRLGWMSYQPVWGLGIFIDFGGVHTIWGPGPMQIWALFGMALLFVCLLFPLLSMLV